MTSVCHVTAMTQSLVGVGWRWLVLVGNDWRWLAMVGNGWPTRDNVR